jgi:nucleoside-diphosphate-sugar epimerase
MSDTFLVTGAHGCIGAWVVRRLVAEETPVVALDASTDDHRLRQVLEPGALEHVVRVRADITDLDAFAHVLDAHAITHVIHLAALQVPFCRADPPLGARVNVVGTVNVFEAVARRGTDAPVVYASSIAAYDALEDGPSMQGAPSTLYGVYKRANEGTAAVFAAECGVASVGLRPHTVYGVARDQGLTSAPTTAMLAAAAGRDYQIPFGGRYQLQHAADAARDFVLAARSDAAGAQLHNLPGTVAGSDDVIAAIEAAAPEMAGRIAAGAEALPFPAAVDAASLDALLGPRADAPLADGVADTIGRFRALLARGLISAEAVAPG